VEGIDGQPSTRLLIGGEAILRLQTGRAQAGSVSEQADGSVAIAAGTELHAQWTQFIAEPFDLFTSRLMRMKV
jgi:hypothetical protein